MKQFFGLTETKAIICGILSAFLVFEWILNFIADPSNPFAQIIALLLIIGFFYLLTCLFFWLYKKMPKIAPFLRITLYIIAILDIIIIITISVVNFA